MDAGPALHAAARLGPYFAWEPGDGEPGWRPFEDLLDSRTVGERVGAGRSVLARMGGLNAGDLDERAVASIIFLGLASRLVSPLLAAAAVGDALPEPRVGGLWWRPVEGGPIPIAWRGLTATDCTNRDAAGVAETLTRTATVGLVQPVLEVFRRRYGLSGQVVWGNVASALGGAAGMIADAAPGRAERAATIVEQMLALAPLDGTAELIRPDEEHARWFLVRKNCCLYYRIPGGGTCGDCVLTPDADRRRHWKAVLARR